MVEMFELIQDDTSGLKEKVRDALNDKMNKLPHVRHLIENGIKLGENEQIYVQ
jgi:hypothetical protein